MPNPKPRVQPVPSPLGNCHGYPAGKHPHPKDSSCVDWEPVAEPAAVAPPHRDYAEIAESRERFLAWFNDNFEEDNPQASFGTLAWHIWQAAERDTRERCAQLVMQEAVDWDYNDIEPRGAVSLFADNVAERIRGKGERT